MSSFPLRDAARRMTCFPRVLQFTRAENATFVRETSKDPLVLGRNVSWHGEPAGGVWTGFIMHGLHSPAALG